MWKMKVHLNPRRTIFVSSSSSTLYFPSLSFVTHVLIDSCRLISWSHACSSSHHCSYTYQILVPLTWAYILSYFVLYTLLLENRVVTCLPFSDSANYKFSCHICTKRYSKHSHLKAHLRKVIFIDCFHARLYILISTLHSPSICRDINRCTQLKLVDAMLKHTTAHWWEALCLYILRLWVELLSPGRIDSTHA